MSNQVVLTWNEVKALPVRETAAWVIAPLVNWVTSELKCTISDEQVEPKTGIRRLVVVGGGTLIDHAKLWRHEKSPSTWLCAVPSLWGSGAEASPVAIRTEGGHKVAHLSSDLRPDARAVFPALAKMVPADAARWGYGDVLAHILEGFFSPLANDELRREMSEFLCGHLLPQPFIPAPEWFELSARACALQARAGVGLIHGIAHVLEPCCAGFGHARICAAFLFPVLAYNVSRGPKIASLCDSYQVDLTRILERARSIFTVEDFAILMPFLDTHWANVIRHPFSRINCTVVRSDSLTYFRNREFLS